MKRNQDSFTRNLVTFALFVVLVVVSFSIGHSVGQSEQQLPSPCEKKQSNHRFSNELRGEDKRKVF